VTEKTVLIVSDIQAPLHDGAALDNVIAFARDLKPDRLVNVGDDWDAHEISQWSRGKAGEYAGTLQAGLDAVASIHARFREAVGDILYDVSRSNHGDRLRKYLAQYAPALSSLRSLDIEELAGYKAAGITYHSKPFEIAPGWLACHGDEGPFSKIPGRTAGLLAETWRASVVCGHTHRAGLTVKGHGHSGKMLGAEWGMEVGHLMDVSKAGYLKGGSCDWQQAIGLLRVRGDRVHPELIPINDDGSFCADGQWYPRAEPDFSAFYELMGVTA
jgi:hypothetical protein